MINRIRWICTTAALAVPAFGLAHHSLEVHYNLEPEGKIDKQGVVKKFSPRNPHTFLVVSVEEDDGSNVDWVVEIPAKTLLLRDGWSFEKITPGVDIRFTGFASWKGDNAALLQFLHLPDETLCGRYCDMP